MNNNSIVSGDAGSDLLVFSSTVATASVYGGTGGDTLTFAGPISYGTIAFGADNDMATFSGAISAATSLLGGAGDDTLDFSNISVVATSVAGGAGADLFTGGISVGSSGVSFWVALVLTPSTSLVVLPMTPALLTSGMQMRALTAST